MTGMIANGVYEYLQMNRKDAGETVEEQKINF